MTLPTLSIGQTVIFYPTSFDPLKRYLQPIAAIVTAIGSVDIALTVFPPYSAPEYRTMVPYSTDAADHQPFFQLTTDAPPSCTDEPTFVSITDTSYSAFTISWTNPMNYFGTAIYYRQTETTAWIEALGTFPDTETFVFSTPLTGGTSYDVRVQNICNNDLYSPGVIVTGVATLPL